MNKKKKVISALAICLVVGLGASILLGMTRPGDQDTDQQAAKTTVVETSHGEIGSIAVTGSFVGSVEPIQQVIVYPKAAGEVVATHFAVGDTVQAGDVLLELDSTALSLELAQQQASFNSNQAAAKLKLEQAQSSLDTYNKDTKDGMNQIIMAAENGVKNAEIGLQQANANLRLARNDYNDAREQGADDSTLDALRNVRIQRELGAEQAQLGLEQAEQALELAKKQVEQQVESTEYGVKGAEIGADLTAGQLALQKLRNTLADYAVKAPISGVIEQKNVDVYDTASPQMAAYVISNKDAVVVTFYVSEASLTALNPGDSVTVEKDGKTCSGSISEVSSMVNPANGLYTVKATVENAPFALYSGSTVKVSATVQRVEDQLMLPIDAVYYDDGTAYVYLFDQNTAKKTTVETGITDAQRIHVVSGVSADDQVIVTWSSSLYDGAAVWLPGTAPQTDGASKPAATSPAEDGATAAQQSLAQSDDASAADRGAEEEPA